MKTKPVLTSFMCSRCGSPLILLEEKTEQLENNFAPITTSTYRCSNEVCQKEKDKQNNERMRVKKEKEEERLKREKERQAARTLARK